MGGAGEGGLRTSLCFSAGFEMLPSFEGLPLSEPGLVLPVATAGGGRDCVGCDSGLLLDGAWGACAGWAGVCCG